MIFCQFYDPSWFLDEVGGVDSVPGVSVEGTGLVSEGESQLLAPSVNPVKKMCLDDCD
jgi:hypothetical protein